MPKIKFITVSRSFCFSAAHRLFKEGLSTEENEKLFGKCSRLHGHDYVMKVTVKAAGGADPDMVVNVSTLGEVVEKEVISLLDHKNLNTDVPFLMGVLPTMENIAKKTAEKLEEPLSGIGAELCELTLAESEKNSVTLHFV
ncbi:6-carboxytetrahydropterin synthase [bacterium]|nr:6-carboxytetrahydropterin synthase [bacterium]